MTVEPQLSAPHRALDNARGRVVEALGTLTTVMRAIAGRVPATMLGRSQAPADGAIAVLAAIWIIADQAVLKAALQSIRSINLKMIFPVWGFAQVLSFAVAITTSPPADGLRS